VPYLQVGGGGAYSDAFANPIQRQLGGAGSFNLQVGFGGRVFLKERCALFYEFDYRHLSNAGLAESNIGLNSGGALFGVSLFF
jgi:hypothetical protein